MRDENVNGSTLCCLHLSVVQCVCADRIAAMICSPFYLFKFVSDMQNGERRPAYASQLIG